MSLRDVGLQADLSPSFLSGLERGETEIAITRLMRLADVYGVSVADLLADVGEQRARTYVPLAESHTTSTEDGLVEISYPQAPRGFVQPFRLILHPGAEHAHFVHEGNEFHQCVQGRARITIAGEQFEMSAGDTAFVAANREHGWENPHRSVAIIVGAVDRVEAAGPLSPDSLPEPDRLG